MNNTSNKYPEGTPDVFITTISPKISGSIRHLINHIHDDKLKETCLQLIDNPKYALLAVAPAALKWHHNYEGGLLAHTVEVTELAIRHAQLLMTMRQVEGGSVNLDVVVAACLWHDLAKIWEYEKKEGTRSELPDKSLVIFEHVLDDAGESPEDTIRWWQATDYYKNIYHITGSMAEFHHIASLHCVDQELMWKVEHAMLGHHGPVKEWGSPVAPTSLEALIVHNADMVSSKFGAAKPSPIRP